MVRHEALSKLDADVREDLISILMSPRTVRAEAIRDFYNRPDGRAVADILIDLEVDDGARMEIIDTLRQLNKRPA